ncbi:hypothetical protein EVAR_94343_1 [Eumeta japonica]|uniref:Secreted protein n=1 Tax=Eumeta variegata TaxID=151549 RepID=A0A4C1TPU9_EUMVA|nr:hypothetical protein EVAR_94343_1 [Eumeta japonica]
MIIFGFLCTLYIAVPSNTNREAEGPAGGRWGDGRGVTRSKERELLHIQGAQGISWDARGRSRIFAV